MDCSLQLHNCLCSEEVQVYELTHWTLYLMVYTIYIQQCNLTYLHLNIYFAKCTGGTYNSCTTNMKCKAL